MIDATDLKSTLSHVVSILIARQFKFHLTGGLASGEIDFTYLDSQATQLGVESILKELRAELDVDEKS